MTVCYRKSLQCKDCKDLGMKPFYKLLFVCAGVRSDRPMEKQKVVVSFWSCCRGVNHIFYSVILSNPCGDAIMSELDQNPETLPPCTCELA